MEEARNLPKQSIQYFPNMKKYIYIYIAEFAFPKTKDNQIKHIQKQFE